jgi:Molecular chaperone (small heat shock protein)
MTDRYNPFSEIEKLFDRMNREFEEIGTQMQPALGRGDFRVDIYETTDTLEVLADLPGFSQDDITVTVQDNVLQITGERTNKTELDDARQHRRERRRHSVSRKLHLPADVDGTEAEANCHDGVLSVKLPKQSPDDVTQSK